MEGGGRSGLCTTLPVGGIAMVLSPLLPPSQQTTKRFLDDEMRKARRAWREVQAVQGIASTQDDPGNFCVVTSAPVSAVEPLFVVADLLLLPPLPPPLHDRLTRPPHSREQSLHALAGAVQDAIK